MMNFQEVYNPPPVISNIFFWNYLLLKSNSYLPRNCYVCPIWNFIFDTDQAQIYSCHERLSWSHRALIGAIEALIGAMETLTVTGAALA
jgi:hypothetical protein